MTAALPPIVPLADLVAELRAMRSIPCLTAADRLDGLPELPLCPTCGGSGDLLDLICDNCGASASLPLGMTCPNHLAKPSPCPDCVDGHVTWQRLVNVFNAVFDPLNSHQHAALDCCRYALRAIR